MNKVNILTLLFLSGIITIDTTISDVKKEHEAIEFQRHVDREKDARSKFRALTKDIEQIRHECGNLCSAEYYNENERKPNCKSLFDSSIFDPENNFKFPIQKLPKYLVNYYSYNSHIKVLSNYLDNTSNEKENHTLNAWAWTNEGLSLLGELLEENTMQGSYGAHVVQRMQKLLKQYVFPKGKHILVIGSTRPWIEAILLAEGASHITTLEYNPYPTDHPKITTISPIDFAELVNSNKAPFFDAMVTFSSLEHSGLGRYGDHLNPWGDVITMGRAWCRLKPGARALVGLPTGNDTICFNSHRIYGPFLYSRLFSYWKEIFSEVDSNVFKEEMDCRNVTQQEYQPMIIIER